MVRTIPQIIIMLESDMFYSIPIGLRRAARGQWLEPPPVSALDILKEAWADSDGLANAIAEELL